ncbi:unnamed protein product, partial [Ectocarpus sp. 12 AP-2014]
MPYFSRPGPAWLVSLATALCISLTVQAKEPAKFPLTLAFTEEGITHDLNYTGEAERVFLFFRVYEIAHYAETVSSPYSPQSVVVDGPAKAIAISFSRKLGRDQIREEFDKSLRKNAQPEWLNDAQHTIGAFMNAIDRDAQEGDQLIFYWLPGGRIFAEFNWE